MEIFLTMFKCHNETFNVWSHFLGSISFVFIMLLIITTLPNMEHSSSDATETFDYYKGDNSSYTMSDFITQRAFDIESEIQIAKTNITTFE